MSTGNDNDNDDANDNRTILDSWQEDREVGPIEVRLLGSATEGYYLETRYRDDEEAENEGEPGPWSEWEEYDLDDSLSIGSRLVDRLGLIMDILKFSGKG